MNVSIERGQELFNRGLYKRATDLYSQIIIEQPDNVFAYIGLSHCLIRLEKVPDAKKTIQKAISLNPNIPKEYILLGTINELEHKHHEAENHYKKAIQLDPSNKESLNAYGVFLLHNKKDESLKYFSKCIQIDSTYWIAYFNLSILFDLKKNYKKSFEYAIKALKFKPGIDNALWALIRWSRAYPKLSNLIFLSLVLFPIIVMPESEVGFLSSVTFLLIINLTLYVRLKYKKNLVLSLIILLIIMLYSFWKFA